MAQSFNTLGYIFRGLGLNLTLGHKRIMFAGLNVRPSRCLFVSHIIWQCFMQLAACSVKTQDSTSSFGENNTGTAVWRTQFNTFELFLALASGGSFSLP